MKPITQASIYTEVFLPALVRMAALTLVAAIVTVEIGYAQTSQGVPEQLTDAQVTTAIEDEYRTDVVIRFDDIDVATVNGIVTLTGEVSDIGAKMYAVRIAESMKGVRSVINRLKVEPVATEPGDLAQRVKTALALDPATDAYDILLDIDRGGLVTLRGTVDSWAERELAERVAMTVDGVAEVRNEIQVDQSVARPDREIADEVRGRLRWDALLEDALIDVEVQDGVVQLTGRVGSAAEKRHALTRAWAAGVREVDDSALEVSWWTNDPRQRDRHYPPRSEAQIRAAVQDALLYDPRLISTTVDVEVQGALVKLRGTVDNLKAKLAAEQDARNTVGVAAVTNYIKVRPEEQLSDEEIERNLRDALALNAIVESHQIEVDVKDGIARLDGTVDTALERSEVRDVASRTKGVQVVRDLISVRTEEPFVYSPYFYGWYPGGYSADFEKQEVYRQGMYYRPDAQIERDIESQFFWSPFVDGDRIEVSVEGGVATLSGSVESWHDRRIARENAYEGGAIAVRDQMQVANLRER